MESSTVRSLLLLCGALCIVECETDDDALTRFVASDSAIGPVHTVALVAQWYESENGHWPERLADVADLGAELGSAIRLPEEPVPIPARREFRELRFEVVNDSLLRLHFDLVPFEEEWQEGIEFNEPDGIRTVVPPDMTIEFSRGVFNVPANRTLSNFTVDLEHAEVLTETGERFVFKNEQLILQPTVFLRPLDE